MTRMIGIITYVRLVPLPRLERYLMSEPRLEDDVAFYGAEMCPDCEYRHSADEECVQSDEPDRMWGDE